METRARRLGSESTSIRDLLEEWERASLISGRQAQAIREHEASALRCGAETSMAPTDPPGPPLIVEALGYLGGVIMLVGATILGGLYWSSAATGVRLALVGLTALALVGAGLVVPDRLGEAAGRLRSVLWALAVPAAGGFFAVVASDVLERHDEDSLIAVFPPTAAVALVLWSSRRTWLQQIAMLVPVLMAAAAVGVEIGGGDSSAPGAATWAVGVAWTALAWAGLLEPRNVGVAAGAFGAVFGAMTMTNDLGALIGLLTAVALVALALWERALPWLGVAALAVLWTASRAAVEWFPGRLSAALTLLLTGGLLVGAAAWVARHGPAEHTATADRARPDAARRTQS
jgi:hypothetical protein